MHHSFIMFLYFFSAEIKSFWFRSGDMIQTHFLLFFWYNFEHKNMYLDCNLPWSSAVLEISRFSPFRFLCVGLFCSLLIWEKHSSFPSSPLNWLHLQWNSFSLPTNLLKSLIIDLPFHSKMAYNCLSISVKILRSYKIRIRSF